MRGLSTFALLALASAGQAQEPGKNPFGQGPEKVRWEYAELTYRTSPGRPVVRTKDGTELPAVPATTTVRWALGDTEVEAKGWDDMAEKLKAPGKEGAGQRLRVLNALGADGWELVTQQTGTGPFLPTEPGARGFSPGATTTLLFKRRVR
jgi:hypothetical protein